MTHPERKRVPDIWRERLKLHEGAYWSLDPLGESGTDSRPFLCVEWCREGLWPSTGAWGPVGPESLEPSPTYLQLVIERLDSFSCHPDQAGTAQPFEWPEGTTWVVVYEGANAVRVITGPVPPWHHHSNADIYPAIAHAFNALTPPWQIRTNDIGRRVLGPVAFALTITALTD